MVTNLEMERDAVGRDTPVHDSMSRTDRVRQMRPRFMATWWKCSSTRESVTFVRPDRPCIRN
jgi:hypothetical protein